jgi:signal transduction histidine kinase
MRRLMLFRSLQVRLLVVLVLAVGIALGTVAVVARASTAAEFTRYVESSQLEMQAVAREIAASTGDRLVVTSAQGRVILDSSGELVGQAATPELLKKLEPALLPPPVKMESGVDVLFVRHAVGPPDDAATWTRPAPRREMLPALGLDLLLPSDREQLFVAAVTRSLVMGVLVGGAVAVALALVFGRALLGQIGALTQAARRMERGDLSQRVVVQSRDEIGQLAHAFNAMADGLARNEQLRRTMVTDVAHELRTPLTNLRGYLEAVRDGVTEPRPEVIESLYEEAMLLHHLVDDLQDLALSEAGRLKLSRERIDVQDVLLSAGQSVQPRALAQGVQLSLQGGPSLAVDADPQRLGQVLRNLLANAIAYTPPGGQVALQAEALAEGVRIEVRDTGCGIAPEHVPNVFERFYRVDASRARATGGAGIGLAVVKQLVDAHGGGVSVSSEPGRGSCFRVTLPYAREPGQGAKALVTPRNALLSAG